MKHFFIASLISLQILNSLEIDKVVIWGHKLHTHTHSYIQAAFHKGFEHLGYKVYWFDDKDNEENFDFSNSFFFTVAENDNNVPIRDDCYYVYTTRV
jgi:hypothetical protein